VLSNNNVAANRDIGQCGSGPPGKGGGNRAHRHGGESAHLAEIIRSPKQSANHAPFSSSPQHRIFDKRPLENMVKKVA